MSDIIPKTKRNDEYYTTLNESEKLVSFLNKTGIIKDMIIWLPFDSELSAIYKALKTTGYNIVLSSLNDGKDFYNYEPEKWDIIISNPPFSNRAQLLHRLISFHKPFIILQPIYFFNNTGCVKLLSDFPYDFVFLLPRTRMKYLSYDENKDKIISRKTSASFYSFWIGFLLGLDRPFYYLPDHGGERATEEYINNGNTILENQLSLFNTEEQNHDKNN